MKKISVILASFCLVVFCMSSCATDDFTGDSLEPEMEVGLRSTVNGNSGNNGSFNGQQVYWAWIGYYEFNQPCGDYGAGEVQQVASLVSDDPTGTWCDCKMAALAAEIATNTGNANCDITTYPCEQGVWVGVLPQPLCGI